MKYLEIIGKCVTRVAEQDVINASGAMQVCAGQKSGGEAAIHAMRNIFEADETDAALLVDVSNAFNSLNRAAALNNIRVLCPLKCLQGLVSTSPSRGANTLALRWAHGPILSNMWVVR